MVVREYRVWRIGSLVDTKSGAYRVCFETNQLSSLAIDYALRLSALIVCIVLMFAPTLRENTGQRVCQHMKVSAVQMDVARSVCITDNSNDYSACTRTQVPDLNKIH